MVVAECFFIPFEVLYLTSKKTFLAGVGVGTHPLPAPDLSCHISVSRHDVPTLPDRKSIRRCQYDAHAVGVLGFQGVGEAKEGASRPCSTGGVLPHVLVRNFPGYSQRIPGTPRIRLQVSLL